MIAKRYQLYLSDAAHRVLNDLIENGHNIRDVLNSGVIMYKKASHEERGVAHMEAYGQPKKEIQEAIKTIQQAQTINYEMLSPEDAAFVKRIRQMLGPDTADAVEDHLTADEIMRRESQHNDRKKTGS